MLTFIDVNRYQTSKTDEKPTTGYLSFSDNDGNPKNRLFVSSLSHGDKITFDKTNAQKMIDFLQKNVIDVEDTEQPPEVKK
jgi:uncharacterized pyridoxamine 5'-phosphate oxidase family protein